ncbi:MAG: hypothetical protein ACKVOE_09050 [Rickettsiales bacterium]
MQPNQFARASDRKEFKPTDNNGFVPRKRTITPPWLNYALLTLMLIVGSALIAYTRSLVGCVVAAIIGYALIAITMQAEKLKAMLQSTEFLSALFSSALGSGYQFNLITTMTGDVVYSNRGFQSLYPELSAQRSCKLADLFSLAKLLPEETEQVLTLVKTSGKGAVATRLTTPKGEVIDVTLEIEPIERPVGFMMVRAK